MERMVLRGLAVFRWAAWVWMATVLALARHGLVRPVLATGLVVAALAVTAVAASWARRRPERLLDAPLLTVEVAVATALLLADGFVYEPGHVFSAEQSLGVAWPIAAILAVGVAAGPAAGALTGALLGTARAVSSATNALSPGPDELTLVADLQPAEVLSLLSTTVLYVLAGAVAGYLLRLLRRAEQQISAARAREEVARTLHDGVLQTLALVERRVDDPALARLARDQEQELRAFLFGDPAGALVGRGGLGDTLREAARRFEATFGGRVDVLVPGDLPRLDDRRTAAIAGAVGEALTNAGKHGAATRVVIYLEPSDGELFCSVKDDGVGFEPATVTERVGLRSSIAGRIAEVGGRTEIASGPGRGAEVRMWVPVSG